MVWSGLGVNYAAAQSSWPTDIAYFKTVGLRNIRIHLTSIPTPWTAGDPSVVNSNAYWRLCAQTFAAAGFSVTWGPNFPSSATPATSSNWQAYHDAVVAEATYLQSQGIVLSGFELGNELEAAADNSTITWSQMRAKVRQLAADVQAVYSLSPITYGTDNIGHNNYSGWESEGLSGLDTLSLHPYPGIVTEQSYSFMQTPSTAVNLTGMAALIASYPGQVYISEFQLDSNPSNLPLLSPEQSVDGMRQLYAFLRQTGILKAVVFTWGPYFSNEANFAMQNTDGSFNPVWNVLLTDNGRTSMVS